jgi:hypothetical protein
MGLYKDGTRKATTQHTHTHPLANPRLRVRLLAFVCLFVLVLLFLSIGSCSRSWESLLVSARAAT